MVLGLHDGLQVVVDDRADRDGDDVEVEAAVDERLRLHVVVGLLAGLKPPCRAGVLEPALLLEGCAARLAGVRDGGHPAVGRIDDDRGAVLAVDLEHRRAGIHPDLVVGTHVRALGGRPAVGVARFEFGVDRPCCGRFPCRGVGLVEMKVVAVLRVTHVWRQRGDVVGPREIRFAGCGAGKVLRPGDARDRAGDCRDADADGEWFVHERALG